MQAPRRIHPLNLDRQGVPSRVMARQGHTIGLNIKALRLKRGLTQGALAERVGVSEATIVSKWERGLQIPRLDTAQDLADALGATVEQLLSDAGDALPEGVADVVQRRPLETATAKMLARLSDRELEAVHALVLRLGEREPQTCARAVETDGRQAESGP